jgi:hypothetical protein
MVAFGRRLVAASGVIVLSVFASAAAPWLISSAVQATQWFVMPLGRHVPSAWSGWLGWLMTMGVFLWGLWGAAWLMTGNVSR